MLFSEVLNRINKARQLSQITSSQHQVLKDCLLKQVYNKETVLLNLYSLVSPTTSYSDKNTIVGELHRAVYRANQQPGVAAQPPNQQSIVPQSQSETFPTHILTDEEKQQLTIGSGRLTSSSSPSAYSQPPSYSPPSRWTSTGSSSGQISATPKYVPQNGGSIMVGANTLTPERKAVVQVNNQIKTTVEQDSQGNLVCYAHRTQPWCEHVEYLVQHHLDAGWQVGLANLDHVPIVPKFDTYAQVIFGNEKAGGVAVHINIVDPAYSKSKKLVFVGYWMPDEGRFVLRSMLIAWAHGIIHDCKCRSKIHGSEAEHKFKSPPTKSYGAANMWSVATEGVCLECRGSYATDVPVF